ncbi:hypothetical protein IKG16_02835, partial [Candidatus Saccharibacteria bacterium]|nr:hypothetical protein [Candidatus Saccharibacteria bacterium]
NKPTNNTKASSTPVNEANAESEDKPTETKSTETKSTDTVATTTVKEDTSVDLPATGPTNYLFSGILIGVAVYLVGTNLNLLRTRR